MNLMNRMMSYDKSKNVIQESCECEKCINSKTENQTVEYPKLSEEEIEQIISERYFNKDDKTKTFIRKALRKHGDRYDYSNVTYVKAKSEVEIICRVEGHKPFLQTPDNHLQGKGCNNCNKSHKLTKETFVLKCEEKFGTELFDYSKFIYVDSSTKGIIVCKRCGKSFLKAPSIHLQNQGCPRCDGIERLNTELYIARAKEIEGNDEHFDYSETNYVNASTKITIICKVHNKSFEILPFSHLKNSYCPYCGERNTQWDTKSFINESNIIYDNFYDYSESVYIDMHTKIKIICPIHGRFEQLPYTHLSGQGCKKCSIEKVKQRFNDSLEKRLNNFINKCKLKYGNLYDLSLVYKDYINQRSKVMIICTKCNNSFLMTCDNFIRGHGCPFCNVSSGETTISIWLRQHNIEFKSQKTFEGCKNKELLKFDFYIPSENMCIEYDGIGHFEKVNWSGKYTNKQLEENLKDTKYRDDIKNKFCKNNGIKLIRINYKQNLIKELCKLFPNNLTIFEI